MEDIACAKPRSSKLAVTQLMDASIVSRAAQDIVSESIEKHSQPSGVFISYTSKHSRYMLNGSLADSIFVEDLCGYISKIRHFPKDSIGYFPPGSISKELMTEQRRWEFDSIAYDFIKASKEFWILKTPDYKKSWWTYGELVTLCNILDNDNYCPDIYIATPALSQNYII